MDNQQGKSKRKPTLAEIKAANKAAGQYFFNKDTMKANGETLKSFRVVEIDGRVFVSRRAPGAPAFWHFIPATGRLIFAGRTREDVAAHLEWFDQTNQEPDK